MAKHRRRRKDMQQEIVTPKYSTTQGGTLTGEHIEVGYYRMPGGTGAKPHQHPNEQIVCILEGRLKYRIGDEEGIAEGGDVLHMPPNVEHETQALEEVVFVSSKNLVQGVGSRIGSIPVEG